MATVPLKPVPNVVKCTVHFSYTGVNLVNVFHVMVNEGSGIVQAEVLAIATGVRNAYKNTFNGIITHDGFLGACDAVDLSTDLGAQATAAGSDQAGIFNPGLSANVAMCITWQIARHYRGGHPRTYLGGIPGDRVANPTSWTGAAVTAASTAATNFRTQVNAIVPSSGRTASLCCVHRYRHGNVLDPPLVDAITGSTVDTRIDSQRRRLGRDR